MIGIIGMLREDKNEHAAGVKTLHDSSGPSGSRFDITGSDPTFNTSRLEMGTNRIRGRPILSKLRMSSATRSVATCRRDWLDRGRAYTEQGCRRDNRHNTGADAATN